MNPDYLLAQAVVWRKTADPEAGLDLVEGLESPDPQARALARALLIDGAETSMSLLESALRAGIASPNAVGSCMAEILVNAQAQPMGMGPIRKGRNDQSLC